MATDNPHPKRNQQRCEWCAKGLTISLGYRRHWDGSTNPPTCTAPTDREWIEELEGKLAAAKEDAERYRWLVKNHESIGFASGDREPDTWVSAKTLSKHIDAAKESSGR